jgi:hypothetical protein
MVRIEVATSVLRRVSDLLAHQFSVRDVQVEAPSNQGTFYLLLRPCKTLSGVSNSKH